jgi:nucleoside 2-deoxyribosyltransferase
MRAYVAVSFSNRKLLNNEIAAITDTLKMYEVIPFVFVDSYQFSPEQEQDMMKKAMEEIDDSEILIAEISEKAIGVGIEAGYAKAKGKTVIYVRHKEAGHSTTASGISDFHIIYTDTADLQSQLAAVINKLK